jgi:glutaredoxin
MRTRRFLNRHGVPYTLIDVDQDPEAAQKVREWNRGYLSTPTLDIEGRIVTEPSDEELARLLGIEVRP